MKVSNKELFRDLNETLKKEKEFGCSPENFQGFLRELGFERPNSRKKMKIRDRSEIEMHTRLCNIFTIPVLKKLGLPLDSLKSLEEMDKER